jgi:hypothetical protein
MSWAMQRGHLLEAGVARQWAEPAGAILEKPPMLQAHPDHPWLLASLDYLGHLPDRTLVVEVKTSNDWREWADGWTPDTHAIQVLTQLAVTGVDEAVLVADVVGRIETRTILRDRVWEEQAIPILSDFWHHNVLGAIPPDPHPVLDYPHMNRIWNTEPGLEVEADGPTVDAVTAWQALRPQHATLTDTVETLRGRIRAGMRDAQHLTIGGQRVATVNKRGALTIRPAQPEEGDPL